MELNNSKYTAIKHFCIFSMKKYLSETSSRYIRTAFVRVDFYSANADNYKSLE